MLLLLRVIKITSFMNSVVQLLMIDFFRFLNYLSLFYK